MIKRRRKIKIHALEVMIRKRKHFRNRIGQLSLKNNKLPVKKWQKSKIGSLKFTLMRYYNWLSQQILIKFASNFVLFSKICFCKREFSRSNKNISKKALLPVSLIKDPTLNLSIFTIRVKNKNNI